MKKAGKEKKYKVIHYYSKGDSRASESEILGLLRKGWKIISSVSDGNKIIYIFEK